MPKAILLLLVVLVSVGATFEDSESHEDIAEEALLAFGLVDAPSTSEFGAELLEESLTRLAGFVADNTSATKEEVLEAWTNAPVPNQQAIIAAVGQVGKPYRYARRGPNSFDCSGLVVYAWGEAGAWLPHQSRQQIRSTEDVWPWAIAGDLVYYPGHIMMYLGVDDLVVHAANRRKGVTFGHIRKHVTFGRVVLT